MNREELLEILKENGKSDPERHHTKCDEALLDFINDLEITKQFKSQTKWYT